MVARAHELSLAVPLDTPIRLAEIPIRQADHFADLDGDVREIPLSEKRALLERLNQEMLATDRRIVDSLRHLRGPGHRALDRHRRGGCCLRLRPEIRLAAGAVAREESFLERAFESWSCPRRMALESQEGIISSAPAARRARGAARRPAGPRRHLSGRARSPAASAPWCTRRSGI